MSRPPLERLDRVRILLTSPKTAGNVGAAARAVKNMGLGGLDIIEPHRAREPIQFGAEARRLAVQAADVLDRLGVYQTLDHAIRPATHIVATTARWTRSDGTYRTPRAAAAELMTIARERPIVILFGTEDHGLPRRLVLRAHAGVQIPASDDYPVLNVAQAVMLVSYELRMAALAETDSQGAHGDSNNGGGARSDVATPGELDALHRDAVDALDRIDYLQPHTRPRVFAQLEGLLTRARPSADEVRMLRGVCRQIRWLAKRAGR